MRRVAELVALALALALIGPDVAAAASCEERVAFLSREMAAARRPARVWSWSWAIGYTVVGGAQLAAAPLLDDEGRQKDFYVGGARTLLAVMPFLIMPLKIMREEPAHRERAAAAGDPCAVADAGERGLERAARSERRGKSLLKHTMVVVVNLAAGLVLGLGFDRWGSGALTAGSGILIGEIMIWTQPTRSVDAWRRYQAGQLAAASEGPSWAIAPTIHPGGAGISFALAF
jgi:hypothetical protein